MGIFDDLIELAGDVASVAGDVASIALAPVKVVASVASDLTHEVAEVVREGVDELTK